MTEVEHTFSWTKNQLAHSTLRMAVHTFPPPKTSDQSDCLIPATPTPHLHHTYTTLTHHIHPYIILTPHLYKTATNSEVPEATLSSTSSSSQLTTSTLAVQTRQREDEGEDNSGNWDHHSYMRIKRRKLQDQYLFLGQQDSTIFAGVTILVILTERI